MTQLDQWGRSALGLTALLLTTGCPPAQIQFPDAQLPVVPADASLDAGDPEDTGGPEDGATPIDAGSEADATTQPDATSGVDSGPAPDTGPRVDAGSVPITGARTNTPNGVRHIYSQIQAWTYDGVYFLAIDINTDEAVVFHAGTWEERARLSRIGHRWISGTHKVLMFDDARGTGAKLYAYDMDTGLESEVLDLGHPGLRAGRSQEEVDRSGRWVAVYIDEPTSGGPRIITADLITPRVGADIAIQAIGCEFEPDWVGVDPTGNFLLVQSVRDATGPCSGLWAHDIQTGAPIRQLTNHHNHGTNGIGPTGRPYFLSTELAHPQDNGSPGIFRYWVDTGEREVVGPPLPWGALEHISCLNGPGTPCMGTGSNEFNTAYTGQVWRLDFDGTRTVIEPHNASGCDYWGQAQTTVGPDGRYAFVSHSGNCNAIHSVVVQ